MPNLLSEDDIEQAMLQRLQHLHGYDVLECFTADAADLNDGSGRGDKREVILHDRLREATIRLNPGIPESGIDDALKQFRDQRQAMSAIAANRELNNLIRDGVQVEFKDGQGRTQRGRMRVIDFNDPVENRFLAVSQLWVESTGVSAQAGYRRRCCLGPVLPAPD